MLSVLSIEDNTFVRMALKLGLGIREDLVEFHEADTLSAGILAIKAGGLDLVILDLNLPDSQGLDTVKLLQKAIGIQPIKILVLTALDDPMIESEITALDLEFWPKNGDSMYRLPIRIIREAMAHVSDPALFSLLDLKAQVRKLNKVS